jgi:glycosyltransferase involved in cell wall biosynthesis
MDLIRSRYLLVIGIGCFVDQFEKRYVDELWYKDLAEHLRYIERLTLAAPRVDRDPPLGVLEIENNPLFRRLHFVDLPQTTSFRQAIIQLPHSLRLLWITIGDAEIVHTGVGGWPIPLGWLAVPIALVRKKKIVIIVESAFWRVRGNGENVSVRAKVRSYVSELISRWCVNRADLSIFTQAEYRRSLLTRGLNRGHVINASWIDNEKVLSDADATEVWKGKSGIGNRLKILFAGRLVADKGVLVLLQAIKELDASNVPIELDVLGDGELYGTCVSFGKELVNSAVVRCLGTVPYSHLFEVLSRYHAVVVPSLSDEQPRIVFDAYSQAVPVIGSDADGIRACVEDRVTGLLAKRDCPEALAARLRAAQGNIDELKRMGMKALEVARGQTHRAMHEKRKVLLLNLLSN